MMQCQLFERFCMEKQHNEKMFDVLCTIVKIWTNEMSHKVGLLKQKAKQIYKMICCLLWLGGSVFI